MNTSSRFLSTGRQSREMRFLAIAAFSLAIIFASISTGVTGTNATSLMSPTPTLSKRCKAIQWHIKDARNRAILALSSGNEAGYDDWMDHVYDLIDFGNENNCGLDIEGNVVE